MTPQTFDPHARRQVLRVVLAAGLPLSLHAEPQPQPPASGSTKPALEHYLYFHRRDHDGTTLHQEPALQDRRFAGAQMTYTWRDLEVAPGKYDFSAIEADLKYLRFMDRKLWIQLQEKSFTPRKNVPDYLLQGTRYGGGVLRQSMASAPERDQSKPLGADEYGWVAMMWLPAVRTRYQALVQQLGRTFDGRIAGINFSESSIDIGQELPDGSTHYPEGFSAALHVQAIRENMLVLAAAFQQSVAMVYLNFLPDEWLPEQDQGYMRGLFAQARTLGMGVGGPDLTPYKKGPMSQSYPFFHTYPPQLFKGMAVQSGNLRQTNPKTGVPYTVKDILDFARDYLGLDAIFWGLEDNMFQTKVLTQLPG